MINLKIDGKKVAARKNETVLEAAIRAGIKIPTLCYHPELEPYGGCRLCIVEVKGLKNPLTACTLPVQPDMEIRTKSPELDGLRRFTLELILSEHPSCCIFCQKQTECGDYQHCIEKVSVTTGCKFCPKNERCDLQKVIKEIGLKELSFAFEYRNQEVERYDPFFDRDYNLCILCGRCTRACQDLRGAATLDFHHRGPRTLVGTAFGLSHLETGCQFCGACVDVCPTGALSDRFGRWQGLPEQSIKTTCILCGIACTIRANIRKEDVIGIEPDQDPLCARGRFGIVPMTHHPKRALYPLIKTNGRLKRYTMEHTLDQAAKELASSKGHTGILFSPQITMEVIDKLTAMTAGLDAIVAPSMNVSGYKNPGLKNIGTNACLVAVNTDLISEFSPILVRLRRQAPDAPYVIIDSVQSDFTSRADLFIKIEPGSELDALRQLLGLKSDKTSIVGRKAVDDFNDLTGGRDIFLIYDPLNLGDLTSITRVHHVPLLSAPNAAYLQKFDLGSANVLLDDPNIDCLYVIGKVPYLQREYRSIIVQDCFVPDGRANIFLPAAAFTEIKGSIVGYDGKIRKLRPTRLPVGESQSDEEIIDALNAKLGVAPAKAEKSKLRRPVATARRPEASGGNNWHMIVRESGYGYRNTALSSLLKGFERIRNDCCIYMRPSEAERMKVRDGDQIRVIGANFSFDGVVKLSDHIPVKSILMMDSGECAGLRSQTVRLECTK